MKKRLDVWITLFAISLLMSAMPARGEISGIVIRGADASTLYIAAECPDQDTPPFGTLPGFAIQSADSNHYQALRPPHADLDLLLDQIAFRIILEHAEDNRVLRLHYPVGMFEDRIAPDMSEAEIRRNPNSDPEVTWKTDEDARSAVHCGIDPNAYTLIFSDPLYVQTHRITLGGLKGEITYYCRACSTDFEGNTSTGTGFRVRAGEEFVTSFPMAACP